MKKTQKKSWPWRSLYIWYKIQHELQLWIYYMSKLLNTSEFINMINSRHLTPANTNSNPNTNPKGPDTPNAIRQRDAIF
jgi:hypothetical protein